MAHFFRNSENPDFSIIIPYKTADKYIVRCLWHCRRLKGSWEILAIDDNVCPGLPAQKRNHAMKMAKGSYLAFIDSDAYPPDDWLITAKNLLRTYGAVCGPGVLPPSASDSQKVTDFILKLLPYSYRVTPKKARIVNEFPTFNLIIKKGYMVDFKPYLTGEDSLLCREIGCAVYYHPGLLVYHNRRSLYRPFWKQVSTYGKHRGFLIKKALVGTIGVVYHYVASFIKGFFRRKL